MEFINRFINLRVNKPFLRFIITSLLLYVAWEAFYQLWLHPNRTFELLVVNNISWATEGILNLLGYKLIPTYFLDENVRTLGIDGSLGVYIADSCAGVPLLALFTGFIIAYPGSIKNKLLFIPFGILTIHFINILRITGLCMVALYAPEQVDFNHHYTFTIIVYSYIFLLWVYWVNKLAKNKPAE